MRSRTPRTSVDQLLSSSIPAFLGGDLFFDLRNLGTDCQRVRRSGAGV
jgi:hypothetical protein